MVLVDTSVWADHFRHRDEALWRLLQTGVVAIHPFVIGELALGNLRPWAETISGLRTLPAVPIVEENDFLALIAAEKLAGSGLNFVDVHLLAACVAAKLRLWTRDKKLSARAEVAGINWTA